VLEIGELERKYILNPGVVRVALIGLGSIARFHLDALSRIGTVSVVGACDPDLRRREAASNRGIPVYASISELFESAKLDVAHILVPPSAHFETGRDCLRRGCHIFVEKPICISSVECRNLIEAADEAGSLVGVNHNQCWNPAFRSFLRAASGGELGQIKNVTVHYCVDALPVRGHWSGKDKFNSVLELAAHPLSLITKLVGPVREAMARPCEWQMIAGTSVVSSWHAALTCEGGPANCFVSFGDTYRDCSIFIVGEDGSARIDLERNIWQIWKKSQFAAPLDNAISTLITSSVAAWQGVGNLISHASSILGFGQRSDDIFARAFQASVADYYSALLHGRSPSVCVRDGEDVVKACEKVVDSLRGWRN
jgi:predicted dehydrogenase